MIFWNIYDIFFSLQSYLFIQWTNTSTAGQSFRGRQKFGTNRKKSPTNVKHRHVGINRRLIVQFNSNPRVQRSQNGHTNNSASGWRATTTLLNMRFLFLRHSLHVCTWFASALPALFAVRVTKRNENVKKEVILWAQQQLCTRITFFKFLCSSCTATTSHKEVWFSGYWLQSHEPEYFWNRILFFLHKSTFRQHETSKFGHRNRIALKPLTRADHVKTPSTWIQMIYRFQEARAKIEAFVNF